MDQQKQELASKLKDSNNILVTVSANPSVDQLAACLGLTLLLNKLKKHATAVFSGEVPSTIEFLQPEETLEKNTDSLRDFIISLDKAKADKLRYKVEDRVVKIFITPYRTSIGEDDLEFSQGDFNVDVVLCLGVQQQQDLDQAITAHGRILHDAVVTSISTRTGGQLGTVNWVDPGASSLSELAAALADELGKDLVDGQIATALLTGIVAETARFSNEKTSPETMRLAAELMAAGANQQLVATELQESAQPAPAPADDTKPDADDSDDTPSPGDTPPPDEPPQPSKPHDGTLEIDHPEPEKQPDEAQPAPDSPVLAVESPQPADDAAEPASRLILQPPKMGGTLTANTEPEGLDPSIDPLAASDTATDDAAMPALEHGEEKTAPEPPVAEPPVAPAVLEPPKPLDLPAPAPLEPTSPLSPNEPDKEETLNDIEKAVGSSHIDTNASADTQSGDDAAAAARDAVHSALQSGPSNSLPQANADVGAAGYLNVQDLPSDADASPIAGTSYLASPNEPGMAPSEPTPVAASPADQPLTMPQPIFNPDQHQAANEQAADTAKDPAAPPPVPPPMTELPPFQQHQ